MRSCTRSISSCTSVEAISSRLTGGSTRIAPRPGQGFQDISYSRQAGVQFDGNCRGVGFSCRFLNSDVITVFQVKAKLCQDLLC